MRRAVEQRRATTGSALDQGARAPAAPCRCARTSTWASPSAAAQRLAQRRRDGRRPLRRRRSRRDGPWPRPARWLQQMPRADLVAAVGRKGDAVGEEEDVAPSAEPAGDERPEPVGEPERQLLPGGDLQPVFRVERVDLARRRAVGGADRVDERLSLEAPDSLARMRRRCRPSSGRNRRGCSRAAIARRITSKYIRSLARQLPRRARCRRPNKAGRRP